MTPFRSRIGFTLSLALALTILCLPAFAASRTLWTPLGPDGGDARSFAMDPRNPAHVYLGTADGWVYETNDSGATWQRLAKLSSTEDLILDNIVVDEADPNTLYIGAWVLGRPAGGFYVSHDAGKTWTEQSGLKGQSVRALAQAPSNPQILVAGTLAGVFRSEDGGASWKLISPPGSLEIHEVESVAIDPKNPSVIYAGTWHLPWKTNDGGSSWQSIRNGLITDSDVFSIIIDPIQSNVVYASACSGIYKSENSGELFRKIQGIPSSARRTRVLMQDPEDRAVVYAGTTEGLYKTTDSGSRWQRMTGPDVIVNDVYVDPRNPRHVLLATDRSGVLSSDDAGVTFTSSNRGFSQRQVAALLVDAANPRTLYAGVLNDKGYGGVFVSTDGGAVWKQQSNGLDGRDVFSLAQGGSGVLLAGTNDGLFRWSGAAWRPDGSVLKQVSKSVYVTGHHRRRKVQKTVLVAAGSITGRVNALATSGDLWVAAASSGLYTSRNSGQSWQGGAAAGQTSFRFAAVKGNTIVAGRGPVLVESDDAGVSWRALALPAGAHWALAASYAGDGSLWLGSRDGAYVSRDQGQTWTKLARLPVADINGVSYDAELKRIVLTSGTSNLVLAVDPATETWNWWNPGWRVHTVLSSEGRLLGASFYNGVVVAPAPLTTTAENRR